MTKSTHPLRVVTCCYCGARSQLAANRPGLLVCHGCGAGIRKLEGLQPALEKARKRPDGPGAPSAPKPAIPHRAEMPGTHLDKDRPAMRRKGKRRNTGYAKDRRRSLWYHLREAFDDVDDLFDLDIFD